MDENRKKDILLFLWIFILFSLSILAIGGTISRILQGFSNTINSIIPYRSSQKIVFLEDCQTNHNKKPTDYLRCYISKKYEGKLIEEVPPIGSILDSLQVNTSWRDINAIKDIKKDEIYEEEDFRVLFEIIENKLIAISADNLQETTQLSISNEVLPAKYRFVSELKDFEPDNKILPPEAKNWIIRQRNKKKQLELVDTFVLLSMLGALGSIIFLVSDRIKYQKSQDEIEDKERQKNAKSIISYIYRPIFGMLLAIATFITTVSINGITSRTSIEDLETDSILFLALSAGLLTDKVYEKIMGQASNSTKSNSSNKNDKKT